MNELEAEPTAGIHDPSDDPTAKPATPPPPPSHPQPRPGRTAPVGARGSGGGDDGLREQIASAVARAQNANAAMYGWQFAAADAVLAVVGSELNRLRAEVDEVVRQRNAAMGQRNEERYAKERNVERLNEALAALAAERARADGLEATMLRVKRHAQACAVTWHARTRGDAERDWLDVLAIIERAALADEPTGGEE